MLERIRWKPLKYQASQSPGSSGKTPVHLFFFFFSNLYAKASATNQMAPINRRSDYKSYTLRKVDFFLNHSFPVLLQPVSQLSRNGKCPSFSCILCFSECFFWFVFGGNHFHLSLMSDTTLPPPLATLQMCTNSNKESLL